MEISRAIQGDLALYAYAASFATIGFVAIRSEINWRRSNALGGNKMAPSHEVRS